MFCRNCGQKLEEGDKFCSSCGARTVSDDSSNIGVEDFEIHIGTDGSNPQMGDSPSSDSKPTYEPFDFSTINFGFDLDLNANSAQAEAEEEAKRKPLITPVEDFDWNIHTFPGMEAKKTEDIDFNWSMPVEEEKPEPVAEPKAETAPDIDVKPEPEVSAAEPEVIVPEQSKWKDAQEPEKPASDLEDHLFGDLNSKTDEARKQSEEIDRFFTFHEKNEQFQKLLDQEYEKIKSGNILADEITTASAASEEKFASRKPEDPMEELFASEGIVKGYEPKPVETDVLERIDAAEAEKKAREESERLIEEARLKAEEEARAAEEARIKAEEEAAARKRLEEEAKRAADARAAQEAAEREAARAAARKEAQAAMKATSEETERKRREIEARIEAQAARLQAEAEERLRAEAEARAKAEEEARLKAEAEEKARAEETRRKAEEERAREEARAAEEARLKAEAEERERAEAKAAKEAEEIRRAAEEKAAREAAEREQARAAEQESRRSSEGPDHISEMAKAREDFFGTETDGQQEEEVTPVKTKAVDKAAILAGMATASEMVQRDRAFAAAEAAKAETAKPEPPQEPEFVDLPDFLGHPEETETPEPELREEEPDTPDTIDLLEELKPAEEEAAFEMPEIPEEREEEQVDIFSIDDLLGDESLQEPEEEPAEELLLMEDDPAEAPAEPEREEIQTEGIQTEEIPVDETAEPEEEPVQTEETPAAAETEQYVRTSEDMSMTGEHPLFDDEYEEEEYTGGKGRLVLKICLIILILLLAIEIAGVVIKVVMPSSGAAKFIDQKLNQVIHLVTGDDKEYSVIAAAEDIRQKPVEDKTELIQAEMGKNKDGNIASIEYNADLKFDPDKDYENTDIALTQNLADVTWYKDAANKQVYYDQAIVGTVIAYGSQRVNMANYKDASVLSLIRKDTDLYDEIKELGEKGVTETFKTLQIGEIRQAGSQYYVWVSEQVKSTESGTSTTAKVYEMTPEGETMKMVASYTA